MDRRNFIKQSGLVGVGGLLLPEALVSCRKETLFEKGDFDGSVLIIGAGAAGLYAAYLLKQYDIPCTILEASDRYGGRLRKLEGFADFPLDLGAEWMHGKRSVIGDLARSKGTKTFRDNSDTIIWFQGSLQTSIPKPYSLLLDEDEFFKTSGAPISLFHEAVGRGVDFHGFPLIETLAGEFGASSDNLSTRDSALELEKYSSGNTDFKFPDTFFDFFDRHIASEVTDNIILDSPVEAIDYSGERVVVSTNQGQNYTADKCIITVPITILQDEDITFQPELSFEKRNAFHGLGMERGMKVFLKFQEKFYHDNIVGGQSSPSYANSAYGREVNDNVLMAFVMGISAENLKSSNQGVVPTLLAELDLMYDGQATQNFVDSFVMDWGDHPFVRGAYSYNLRGSFGERERIAEPVDNKLFFAGEATNTNGHFQTVHGAVETAYREVIRIIESAQ